METCPLSPRNLFVTLLSAAVFIQAQQPDLLDERAVLSRQKVSETHAENHKKGFIQHRARKAFQVSADFAVSYTGKKSKMSTVLV